MSRRLLVLCYFYPPHGGGGVHRVLGYTRYLPRAGWDCTVVCAGPEDYWVTDERLLAEVPPEVEVVRVPGGSALAAWLQVRRGDRGRRPGNVFGALRRLADFWLVPDPYVNWAARGRKAAARCLARGGFDALLSTSPPDSVHLAALELAERTGIPWVADFRDPWMGLYHRVPPTAWHAARQAELERRVLARADLVLTATRAHAERIAEQNEVRVRRVIHLPNGFEPMPPDGALADAAHFVLAFTGTLSQMPEALVFLDALHDMLAHRPEARRRLRVTLAGPYDVGVEDRAIALGLSPGIVAFPGPIAHAESRALQRRADLLLLWKMERMRDTIPGKLYEYLDAGRPVLAALEPDDEAAGLVARAAGEQVAPGDRAALTRAIDRAYVAWLEHGRAPDRRPEWIDEHARATLARRLAGELDALIAARSGAS